MGKRKNRNAQSRREVMNRELTKQRNKTKVQNNTYSQLHMAMEQARNTMRDRNRRESRNDID